MFFVFSLLTSYNVNITPILLLNCSEYDIYKTQESFKDYVLDKRNTYAASRAPRKVGKHNKRTQHRLIPIMIGSFIDVLIRGIETVNLEKNFWGGFYVNGSLCCYANFATFDALSLHPFSRGSSKSIEWYFYHNNQGASISYNGYSTTCTYLGNEIDNWIELVNTATPYSEKIQATDYYDLFNAMLETPYSVTDVENKIIMDAPNMFLKVLKRFEELNTQKLKSIFSDGTFYTALSKNADIVITKQYAQTTLRAMIDGKGDKLRFVLPQCTKQMSTRQQNSSAVLPSNDVNTIYCMLDVKDMKSAGETNTLTRSTILTQETNDMLLYIHLKSLNSDGGFRIAINGFLINVWVDWTKELLITIKEKFPFIVTKVYGKFVNFKTKSGYAVKYCEADDTLYSSAEQTYWKPTFRYYDNYSDITTGLGEYYYKTAPSKNTVALNNIKGSVALYDNEISKTILTNTLGTTCCMKKSENMDFTKFAIIDEPTEEERNFRKDVYKRNFEKVCTKYNLNSHVNDEVTNYDKPIKVLSELNYAISGNIYLRNKKTSKIDVYNNYTTELTRYINEIYNTKKPEFTGFEVMCAFGNANGKCVEDGIVIDEELSKQLPLAEYFMKITVSLIFSSNVKNDVKIITNDNSNDDLVAVVVSSVLPKPKHSLACKVNITKIGTHYYSQIFMLTKVYKQFNNHQVCHFISGNKVVLVLTANVQKNIRTGSKISNQQGQKNIVTDVRSLKSLYGYTKNGDKIHAQILYSDVSLIGRIAGGQLYSMMNSEKAAYSEAGHIIGK